MIYVGNQNIVETSLATDNSAINVRALSSGECTLVSLTVEDCLTNGAELEDAYELIPDQSMSLTLKCASGRYETSGLLHTLSNEHVLSMEFEEDGNTLKLTALTAGTTTLTLDGGKEIKFTVRPCITVLYSLDGGEPEMVDPKLPREFELNKKGFLKLSVPITLNEGETLRWEATGANLQFEGMDSNELTIRLSEDPKGTVIYLELKLYRVKDQDEQMIPISEEQDTPLSIKIKNVSIETREPHNSHKNNVEQPSRGGSDDGDAGGDPTTPPRQR